jgi:type II secretory pathway pseudopilin PulG
MLSPLRGAPGVRGFALIDLLFVCAIIGILCSIALPRLALARQSAGGASAIASLRIINSAQLSFAVTCGRGFYAPNLTILGTRPAADLEAFVPADLGSANTVTKSGYLIQVAATAVPYSPSSCNGAGAGQLSEAYKAAADAIEPSNPRSYATNANGTIWEHTSSLFAAMPENGEPPIGVPVTR